MKLFTFVLGLALRHTTFVSQRATDNVIVVATCVQTSWKRPVPAERERERENGWNKRQSDARVKSIRFYIWADNEISRGQMNVVEKYSMRQRKWESVLARGHESCYTGLPQSSSQFQTHG